MKPGGRRSFVWQESWGERAPARRPVKALTVTAPYRLVELGREHLRTLNAWRNDPQLIARLGANFLHIGLGVDEAWFDGYVKNRSSQVRLAILDSAGVHVGNVNLTQIHAINRNAEFSVLIGDPAHWRRGAGSFALSYMVRHAFDDLNLHRVWLHVLADNEPARRLYLKHGFEEEGVLKQSVYKEGSYRDLVVMARLR